MSTLHLIGASVPRSGHNLLVRLLQALFPLNLFYCEYYGVAGCCQAAPCARRGVLPITFQKTHDFELNVPRDIPGVVYVILYRVPVPAVLSAREIYADDYGEAVAADRDEYAVWLGRNAEYYVSFTERWIHELPPHSVLIDYDDLAQDPAEVVRQVLDAAGLRAEEQAISEAVAKTMPHGGLFGERPYVPRLIEQSRLLDRELVSVYESIVLDHVPELVDRRSFDPVEYRGTLTWRVFEALRVWRAGDTDAAIDLLDRAIETAPQNALLYYEHAALLQVQRRFVEAQRSLQRAALLFPAHRPILEASVTVSLAAGDPSAIVESMEQLDALTEPTLTSRLRIALVRTHGGDGSAGEEILAKVQRELPDDAAVWRIVSEIRRARAEYDQALAAINTAIQLAPLQGEPYAYRADLLLEVGRPDEAINALRAGLVIDARQRSWWLQYIEAHLAANDPAGALAAVNEALQQFPCDDELRARLDELAGEVSRPPDRRLPQQREITRLEIQLAQVRGALGAAERRLYETEARKQLQLEESWDQTHRLDEALQEKEQAMQEAWAQARLLDEALQEKEQALQEAWAQARLLDEALQEKEQALQEVSSWARKLDTRARRLRRALLEADPDSPVLDEQWM